jgi:hypothetical protein
MIDAYMICDMGNPLSMRYVELSLASFERVSDIISITPVQCTTPETLPIRFEKNQEPIPFYVGEAGEDDYLHARFFGGTFCDNEKYNSIMHSQLMFIERIAAGEPIAIMEHDAALINEESFRTMIDEHWGEVDVCMPGTCMECYGMSQRYAEFFVNFMYNFPYLNQRISGPFGVMHHLDCPTTGTVWPDDPNGHRTIQTILPDHMVLSPTKSLADLDKQCLSSGILNATEGLGYELYEPACKQFFFRNSENTNHMHYELDKPIFETMRFATADGSIVNEGKTGPAWSRDFVIIDD